MTLFPHPPTSPTLPSDRYQHTNPLRRESGLRLLTTGLPEPLRWLLIRAWRRPAHFDGNEALQSIHRQRPGEAQLATLPTRLLGFFTLTELEVSRRVVEAPLSSISRVTRDRLLVAQGAYLRSLYLALATQLGSAEAALAEFQRLLACMD
ncbi:MAG TPA: hypothetical protein VKT82_22675 [Ktedonobacterales bacterium]|nr:hypothetical protein [Ktedonobacterales bacterium]